MDTLGLEVGYRLIALVDKARQGDLLATVNQALAASGLPSAQLQLELTESMLMGGEHQAQLLHRLSALGVQIQTLM